MRIGELAKRADVTPHTIRYYEREGCCRRRADIQRIPGLWHERAGRPPFHPQGTGPGAQVERCTGGPDGRVWGTVTL